MAPTHHHHHTPPAVAARHDRPGLLLASGLNRVLGAGGVCVLMWLSLWWAMQ